MVDHDTNAEEYQVSMPQQPRGQFPESDEGPACSVIRAHYEKGNNNIE
jgi:hypothetical protein